MEEPPFSPRAHRTPVALDAAGEYLPEDPPALPCTSCPYDASCCAYGTSLSDNEAEAVRTHHGDGVVYRTRWGEWRTRVRGGRCVMYRDGGCTIHDEPYYPTTCKGFPWTDGETGAPYEYDVSICGVLAERPELVELQRRASLRLPA